VAQENSFTFKITADQAAALRRTLEEKQFEFREVPYALFGAQAKKLTVNAYASGKLLVQGKGAKEFIEFILEPEILGEARLGYDEVHNPEMFQPHMGVDESGKGDFFGPLVIAGVYTDRYLAYRLLELGVKDSKRISSDKKAVDLADQIKELSGTGWNVVSIGPEKYNELYQKFKNLNRLLAWGHATVIENVLKLKPGCPRALSDQFAHPSLIQRALKEHGKKIVLEQKTKAESDIAVAAASILARAEFVTRLEKLGETAGEPLAKGVSPAVKTAGARIYKRLGEEGLRRFSKEHFKTFREVTGQGGSNEMLWPEAV
jgi:ribonuclease HIII